MKTIILFFSFLVLFFTSCKKQADLVVENTIQDTIEIPQKKTISSIGESLSPKAQLALRNWEEYQLVDELLTRYYAISNAEALSNAVELSDLTRQLKDSINDKRLESSSVKARLNLLHSECKRLEDMVEIPAINQEEVTVEIRKILDAFSALNAKFNSVYAIDELEKELDLDPDFQAMIKPLKEEVEPTNRLIESKRRQETKPSLLLKNQKKPKQNTNRRKPKSVPSIKEFELREKPQIDPEKIKKRIDKEALFKKEKALKKSREIK